MSEPIRFLAALAGQSTAAKAEAKRARAREYQRKRRLNPEVRAKERVYGRWYNDTHPGRHRGQKSNEPTHKLDLHRRRTYGLTAQGFEALLREQDGRCAICRGELPHPHVDHDHAEGLVRGILCVGCNVALAYIERPGFVEAARAYLAKDRSQVA